LGHPQKTPCSAQRYLDLATCPGVPEAVRARMAEGVWEPLGPDPLWQSMPGRVNAAVIRAKGLYTHY